MAMASSPFDLTTATRARRALALVRIVIGAMFVSVFFENLRKGLYTPTGYANLINVYVTRGHAPEAWKAVMRLMADNAAVAAPLQGVTEISFGVLLLLGLFTPPVAFAAFGFLTSLWVSEWGTAWIWELLVPMGAALAVSIGAAGRTWGLDQILARRKPNALLW
jgi:uncharacterized membrane protein YphA (DoxX/SURF4 family)